MPEGQEQLESSPEERFFIEDEDVAANKASQYKKHKEGQMKAQGQIPTTLLITILAMASGFASHLGFLHIKLGNRPSAITFGIFSFFITLLGWSFLRKLLKRGARGRAFLLGTIWLSTILATTFALSMLAFTDMETLEQLFRGGRMDLLLRAALGLGIALAINFLPLLILANDWRQSKWLEEETRDLRTQLWELEQAIREKGAVSPAVREELEREIRSLKQQLAEAAEKMHQLQLARKILEGEAEQVDILKQAIKAMEGRVREAETSRAAAETQAEVWGSQVALLEERLTKTQAEIRELRVAEVSYRDITENLHGRIAALEAERDETRRLFDERADWVRELEERVQNLQLQGMEASAETQRLRAHLEEGSARYEELQRRTSELELEKQQLASELARAHQELETLGAALSAAKSEGGRLLQEKARLQGELDKAQSRLRRLEIYEPMGVRFRVPLSGGETSVVEALPPPSEPGDEQPEKPAVDPAYGIPLVTPRDPDSPPPADERTGAEQNRTVGMGILPGEPIPRGGWSEE